MTDCVRICLVGAGRAARVHARSLVRQVAGGRLVALVDTDRAMLAETADRFDITRRFGSLDAALDWGAFEAVAITTPTFTHRALAVEAAQAGKHVFLEKPMALTLEACDQIIEATARSGVFLQLGFMRRFAPEFQAAFARIRAGEIGRPMLIKSLTHGPGLPPPWARDLATSNGMLAEVNSHDWDCMRWLMNSDLVRVYAEVANFKGEERGVETPNFYDNVLVSVRFESGGLGCLSGVCPCEYGYDARVEIVGERGLLQVGTLQGQPVVVCTDRQQGLVTPIFKTWPERFESAYVREMEHFVHCIRDGIPPAVDGQDGRMAVAGVLAGTRSFLEERPVYLSEVLGES